MRILKMHPFHPFHADEYSSVWQLWEQHGSRQTDVAVTQRNYVLAQQQRALITWAGDNTAGANRIVNDTLLTHTLAIYCTSVSSALSVDKQERTGAEAVQWDAREYRLPSNQH